MKTIETYYCKKKIFDFEFDYALYRPDKSKNMKYKLSYKARILIFLYTMELLNKKFGK